MTLIDFSQYRAPTVRRQKDLPQHPLYPAVKERPTIQSFGKAFTEPKLRQQDIAVNQFYKKYGNRNLTTKDVLEMGVGPMEPKKVQDIIAEGARITGAEHRITGGKEVDKLSIVRNKYRDQSKNIRNFTRCVVQAFPDTIAGVMLSVMGAKTFTEAEYGQAGKMLFGEDLQTIPQRLKGTSQAIKDITGVEETGPIGEGILPVLGVGGMIVLDLFDPFFGGAGGSTAKQVTKGIIKAIGKQTGEEISQKLAKEIAEDVAKAWAKKNISTVVKKQIVKELEQKWGAKLGNEIAERGGKKLSTVIKEGADEVSNVKVLTGTGEDVTTKISRFGERVSEALPEGKKVELPYGVKTNVDTLTKARQIIKDIGVDDSIQLAKQSTPTAESNTVGQLLVKDFIDASDFNQAIDLIEDITRNATKQGQAIQSLRMWGQLTPEGFLKSAQRTINKANDTNPGLKLTLDKESAGEINDLAKQIPKTVEGSRARDVAVAKTLDRVAQTVPPTIGQQVSSLQTMAQLLNYRW